MGFWRVASEGVTDDILWWQRKGVGEARRGGHLQFDKGSAGSLDGGSVGYRWWFLDAAGEKTEENRREGLTHRCGGVGGGDQMCLRRIESGLGFSYLKGDCSGVES